MIARASLPTSSISVSAALAVDEIVVSAFVDLGLDVHDRLVDGVDRVAHLLHQVGEVERLAAADRAPSATSGDGSVPASIWTNLLPTRPSF